MSSIALAPPPWTLKGKIWSLPIYVTSKMAATLSSNKPFIYSATEEHSTFSADKFVGGLALAQVIRYTGSPAGPYDELVISPGYLEREIESKSKDGKTILKKQKNLRVTKIFVSQKTTCLNGRKNWNIPKHLAKFIFDENSDGSTSIAIYPFTLDAQGYETIPSSTPFFAATYKRTAYLPSFPMSTATAKYLGIDLSFAQPPLPAGKDEELVGTDEWCSVLLTETSKKTSIGWWDMKQEKGEESALLSGEGVGNGDGNGKEWKEGYENWWPGIGRWRLGMLMEEAEVDCPAGTHWKA